MVPGILLPLPTFPFFFTVKSHTSSGWNSEGDSQRSQVTRRWREHRELRDQRRITRLHVYLTLGDLVSTKYSSVNFYFAFENPRQMTREYIRKLRQVEKFSFNETSRTTTKNYLKKIQAKFPVLSKTADYRIIEIHPYFTNIFFININLIFPTLI